MGPKVASDVTEVASIYSQDRETSRTAYSGSRRTVLSETEQSRDRQRSAAVSQMRSASSSGERKMGPMPTRARGVQVAGEKPKTVARIAHFDLNHKHVHGPKCGHYNYGGRWHDFDRHHRHGSGCGHHFRGGIWVSFSLGHSHGPGCGHFYDHGRWLSHSGIHRHGSGCGHYFYSGVWRNYPRTHVHFNGCGHYRSGDVWFDFPLSHRHSSHCGHLYDGLGWYTHGSVGHVHGSGCGHYYYESRWNLYPRRYYTRNRRDCFYFFVDLGDYRRRNITTRVYERTIYRDEEPIDVFEAGDPISRAYAAFGKGSFYESVIAFNEAIDEDPENGILFMARAQAHIAIQDYRAAYEDLIEGMELVPEWTDVDFNIAELYSDPAWFEEHFDKLNQWVGDFPRDYKAHFVLGYIHYFRQDYAAAKSEFIYALAWDENHEQANRLMTSILEFEAESEVMAAENEPLEETEESEEL